MLIHGRQSTTKVWVTDDGLLILVFDEPIDIDSINVTLLTLQSSESITSGIESLTLSGGNATTTNQLQVIINMTTSDVNIIKQQLSLLRGVASSYISFPADFITDVSGNFVTERNVTNALIASEHFNDATDPRLLAFDMDMNTGVLTLYFSETVDVSTFDFTGITLQLDSTVTQPVHYYNLTSSTELLVDDAPTVPILISNDDLNVLKTRQIGRTESMIWLMLTNYTVMDVHRNLPVNPILNGFAKPVRMYTNDSTPPRIDRFDLDLTAETLTLYFDESVDRTSLNVSQISLSPGPSYNESFVYTLSEVSVSMSENVPKIVIKLGRYDLNRIKQNTLLATSPNDTYIYYTQHTIVDTFGNQVVERNASDALDVARYEKDNISPVFTAFDWI